MTYTPDNIHQQRKVTENQKPMAGIMAPSFRCKQCGVERKVQGRKQLVKGAPRFGFICRECAQ